MSVGEALVHGLLGGTIQTSEHIVTDWKDRVKRARDQAELEEQREHDAKVRKEEWAQRDKEAKERRDFEAGENKLTREHDTSERLGTQDFTSHERDQNVHRETMLYEDKLKIDEQYRIPGTQYTWNTEQTKLIPVKPGDTAFGPPVAEMDKEGKFSWLLTGTSKKGLLGRSGSGSGGSDSSGYEDIKTPSGGPLGGESVTTIYTDADGKEWEHIRDPMGNLIRVPLTTHQERPVVVSPEQQLQATQFAENTVNDLAKYFATDATDFSDWGGSREAAKEYFRQNHLQGTHLDEQGRLRLPGANQPATPPTETTPSKPAVTQTNDRTEAFTTMYGQLSPDQQNTLKQAIKAIQIDKRDPAMVKQRLLDYGFTPEQMSLIF